MMAVSSASMIMFYVRLLRESAVNVTLPASSLKIFFIILLYSSNKINLFIGD